MHFYYHGKSLYKTYFYSDGVYKDTIEYRDLSSDIKCIDKMYRNYLDLCTKHKSDEYETNGIKFIDFVNDKVHFNDGTYCWIHDGFDKNGVKNFEKYLILRNEFHRSTHYSK